MANLQYLTAQAVSGIYARLKKGYVRPAYLDKVMVWLEGHDAKTPWVSGYASAMEAYDPHTSGTEKPVAQYIELSVEEFKASCEVPLKDMRRDLTNSLSRAAIIGDLAKRDMEHPETLFLDALIAGAATEGYDGSYIFATDHTDDGGSYTASQSNAIDSDISDIPVANHGTTTNPSNQEFAASIMAGVAQMQGFKDSMGNYVNRKVASIAVFCSSSMYMQAMSVNKSLDEYGGSNALEEVKKKTGLKIEVISDSYLSAWTAKIVIVRTDVPRTFMLGIEEDLPAEEALSVKSPANSDYCETYKCFTVKRFANRKVKAGDWRNACQVTFT